MSEKPSPPPTKPEISTVEMYHILSTFFGVVASSSDPKAHQSAGQKALAELRAKKQAGSI